MIIKKWDIEEQTGYKPLTTFYNDFSVADIYGEDAILDTYNRAIEIKDCDYKYLTELVMVLNWKIFEYYGHNDKYYRLYNYLWIKAQTIAETTLKGSELEYYYRTTD